MEKIQKVKDGKIIYRTDKKEYQYLFKKPYNFLNYKNEQVKKDK